MVLLQCLGAHTNISVKSVQSNYARIPPYSLSSSYPKFYRCRVSPEPRRRLQWINRSAAPVDPLLSHVLLPTAAASSGRYSLIGSSPSIRRSTRRHSSLDLPPLLLLSTLAVADATGY
jgi:hypothetical protein